MASNRAGKIAPKGAEVDAYQLSMPLLIASYDNSSKSYSKTKQRVLGLLTTSSEEKEQRHLQGRVLLVPRR